MTLEGTIRIRLAWDGRQVCRALIEPRTLVPLNALLRGKQPEDALRMIPMLFSLCGQAQAAAAASALEAAASNTTPSIPLLRERRVLMEALQETLWRLLLDLPHIMRAPAHPELLATLRRALADCLALKHETDWQNAIAELEKAVAEALLADAATELNEIEDAEGLIQALNKAPTSTALLLAECWSRDEHSPGSAVTLMPCADPALLLANLAPTLRDDTSFPLRPTWQGHAIETGALARMQYYPPIARLLEQSGPSTGLRLIARLLEVGALFSRLRAPELPVDSYVRAAPCGAGAGIASVQNARGLLLHRVALDKHGRIADYCLVAPTEWNFHPAGSCAQGIVGRRVPSLVAARQDAELLVHSLDPCVAYQIEVDHA